MKLTLITITTFLLAMGCHPTVFAAGSQSTQSFEFEKTKSILNLKKEFQHLKLSSDKDWSAFNYPSLYKQTFDYALEAHNEQAANLVFDMYANPQIRDTLKADQSQWLHRLLISFRQYAKADFLRLTHPELADQEPSPYLRNPISSGLEVMEYKPNQGIFETTSVDIENLSGVIVVSFAGCGFSRQAFADISKDPEIGKFMSENSHWVSAAWTPTDPKSLKTLAQFSPDRPIKIVWAQSEWTDIKKWSTPTFYIYKNGKLIGKLTGWPRGESSENLSKLKARLNDAGLMVSREER